MIAACAACSAQPTLDSDPTTLGSVSNTSSVTCPADAPAGATCTALVVRCPRLDDLGVTVVSSGPASPAATILLHNNVGGVTLLDDGFAAAYLAAGFRVVQVEWQSDWEQSSVGIKHAACRYATLLEWIFANVHGNDVAHGFCAQAWGGGSGGLAFALAHYGAGDFVDAVTMSAGPPFARLDLGCDPTTPPRAACAALPAVPVSYSDGVLQIISKWERAPSCGASTPAPEEIARWSNDSVVSAGATLSFPRTSISAWYCANNPDATVGQGTLFFDQLSTAATVHCVDGGAAGGSCDGEAPWPSALPDMVEDMVARCIPRH